MRPNFPRISQLIFLAAFLFLFVQTEYRGSDDITVAVNSFFRVDPLVLASYVLSVKGFTILLLPGVLMVIATFLLGRFFCGWICPLGTVIDLLTRWIRKKGPSGLIRSKFKYYLLFSLLFAALFNVNIAGIFDPIAILVRALTFFLYPLAGFLFKEGWTGLFYLIGEKRDVFAPMYGFLREYLLPFRDTFYPLAFISVIFLLAVFYMERFEERNWCRNICPAGTLLGIIGRFSIFKRIPSALCEDCRRCAGVCPSAFEQEVFNKEGCIRCMRCRSLCRFKRVDFLLRLPEEPLPVRERRVFLVSLVAGFGFSKIFSFQPPALKERLLRPPGVTDEKEFLKKCVRCGECMKVCLKNALYPDYFRGGIYGLFMPVIIPRLGYCEYNCTLCGQVCPTAAIPRLPLGEKRRSVIGIASIDRSRCLPFAKKANCIVCEEHCPVPEKAIKFEIVHDTDYRGKRVVLKRPYVLDDLCIGCGICEYVCPLEGRSAIEVFSMQKRTSRG